jgi:hypothetical protein
MAPIVVAGGLLASGAIPAADASPAASIITISATSPNYPGLPAKDHGLVDGYALVVYRDATDNARTGTISGTVTTTAANDTAQLLAEPFGTKSYSAVGSPVSLTTVGANPYSFSVTPTLATHYEVQVTGTDNATSTPVTVYVIANENAQKNSVKNKCTPAAHPTKCVFSFRVNVTLPKSAYKTESRKHVYLYIAIGDSHGTNPGLPKDYTLTKAGSVSKPTRVNSGEFRETLTYNVPIRNSRTDWVPNACTKDTESKDGLGLPGHHGCGNKHVPRSTLYLG